MGADLLATAELLAGRPGGSTPTDLCRAESTIYYALFHTLARMSADLLVGGEGIDRSDKAWRHIYRALEHTKVAGKCMKEKLSRFPPEVQDFADFFLHMQYRRERSDYEPDNRPEVERVSADIERARVKINNLLGLGDKHLKAFAVFILVEKHRHEEQEKVRAARGAHG